MRPSVEELRWASDTLEVVVLPGLGCRIHRLRAFGIDLLRVADDPAAHRDDPFFWGAYVLAPWANRMRAGKTHVAGHTVELPANFPDGAAIHGQVYLAAWERIAESTFAIRHDGDGWPWPYEASLAIALAGDALTLALRLVNRGGAPMPGGIGLHPWFRSPVQVGVSAPRVLPRNDDPLAVPSPAYPQLLDADRPVREGLDATWLDVEPRDVRLRWPRDGITGLLRLRTPGRLHVAVARPPRVDAVAVEPVTNVPWALDEGEDGGMALLPGGGSLDLTITLELRRD
jgi:aldose 1-epimerase